MAEEVWLQPLQLTKHSDEVLRRGPLFSTLDMIGFKLLLALKQLQRCRSKKAEQVKKTLGVEWVAEAT